MTAEPGWAFRVASQRRGGDRGEEEGWLWGRWLVQKLRMRRAAGAVVSSAVNERAGPPGSLGRGHEGPASCPLGKPCTCALRPEEGHGHSGSWGDWVWSGRDRTLWAKGEGAEVNSGETSRVSIVHHPGMEAKLSYPLASSGMARNGAGGGLSSTEIRHREGENRKVLRLPSCSVWV